MTHSQLQTLCCVDVAEGLSEVGRVLEGATRARRVTVFGMPSQRVSFECNLLSKAVSQ